MTSVETRMHVVLLDKQLKASNKALSDAVDFYKLSDSEYDILSNLCNTNFGNSGDGGRAWLGPAKTHGAISTNTLQTRVLSLPFDGMPLLINSAEPVIRIIARWRLKIGR